jgi:hypothetical protein
MLETKQDESLATFQQHCGIEEEMGYEAPFVSLTWERWQEHQASVVQNLSHFQRAIEHHRPQLALLITLELQAFVTELQKEVCAWIDEEGA